MYAVHIRYTNSMKKPIKETLRLISDIKIVLLDSRNELTDNEYHAINRNVISLEKVIYKVLGI